MYSYRFKVPTFFLGCLLLVMTINVVGSHRIRAKSARLPMGPANVQTEEAFAAKVAGVTDLAQLRELTVREHRRVVAADHLFSSVDGLLRTLTRNLLFQSWSVLVLTLCFYLFEFRSPPR